MKNVLTVLVLFISLNLMSQGKESYFGVRVGYLSMDNYTPRKYGGIEFDFQFENSNEDEFSIISQDGDDAERVQTLEAQKNILLQIYTLYAKIIYAYFF